MNFIQSRWIDHNVFPSFKKEGNPNVLNFEKGEPEMKLGVGETKRGQEFQKERGTPTF